MRGQEGFAYVVVDVRTDDKTLLSALYTMSDGDNITSLQKEVNEDEQQLSIHSERYIQRSLLHNLKP